MRRHVPLDRKREAADVAAGVQRYGAAFLRAYNRQRPYASHHVAFTAAWSECGRQPHELERHVRECARYARKHGIRSHRRARTATRRPRAARRGATRPHVRRRPGASSRTSSTDPGAGASDPEPAGASLHTGRQHHTAGVAR